jgi:hypothetical protein
MHEYRAIHSSIREKFVDGSHPKLSLSNDSNNPSTCLSASDILPRSDSTLRRGSVTTRATTPASWLMEFIKCIRA